MWHCRFDLSVTAEKWNRCCCVALQWMRWMSMTCGTTLSSCSARTTGVQHTGKYGWFKNAFWLLFDQTLSRYALYSIQFKKLVLNSCVKPLSETIYYITTFLAQKHLFWNYLYASAVLPFCIIFRIVPLRISDESVCWASNRAPHALDCDFDCFAVVLPNTFVLQKSVCATQHWLIFSNDLLMRVFQKRGFAQDLSIYSLLTWMEYKLNFVTFFIKNNQNAFSETACCLCRSASADFPHGAGANNWPLKGSKVLWLSLLSWIDLYIKKSVRRGWQPNRFWNLDSS